MRNMSFSLTTAQIMEGTKTVTRRLGWLHLAVGIDLGNGHFLHCSLKRAVGATDV